MSEAYKEQDGVVEEVTLMPQDATREDTPAVLDAAPMESDIVESSILNESVDYSEMSPEDFETLEMSEAITSETEPVFAAAFEDGAKTNSKAYAFANALYAADPELESEFEADVAAAITRKQQDDQPSVYSQFSDWVGKHSKKFVAATALMGGLASTPAMAQGGSVFDQVAGQIGKMQEVGNVREQINANNSAIAMHQATIQTLEAQKAALAAQNNATQEVGSVGIGAEAIAGLKEADANHKANKAEFRAQKSALKQQLLSNPQATQADTDRYDAAIARIEAAEAREEAEYQRARAAVRTAPAVQSTQLGVQGGAANQQYVQLSAQQNQLRGEIRRLQLENQRLRLGTVQIITR